MKKVSKLFAALVLVASLVFGLAACEKKDKNYSFAPVAK